MAHSPGAGVRRARALSRVVGAVVGFVLGILYGLFVLSNGQGELVQTRQVAVALVLGSGGAGAVALALAAPLLSVEPYLWLVRTLDEAPPQQILGAALGLLIALLVSALVAVLLAPLPWGLGVVVSLCLACTLVYVGTRAGSRRRDVLGALRRDDAAAPVPGADRPVVVDTSAFIDGRIVDVVAAGFLPGPLLIPTAVLEELQRVADSADPVRRTKGRRGLAVVEELQRSAETSCEVVAATFPGTPEVDSQLLALARLRHAGLLTQDYNLTRLAQVEGIRVLNLHTLALALKPIMASGETMRITIVKEGKEPHQGVGYLDDGTMVVVEHGREHLDETIDVTVTTVLQTSAGRMIFAAASPIDDAATPAPSRRARPVKVGRR